MKITKQAVRGKGVVVAQNCRAAEVGAEILRKAAMQSMRRSPPAWRSDGRAVDERHRRRRLHDDLERQGKAGLDDRYGPLSARKLDPGDYPIVGPGPANPFAWPDILEQRNEVGYHSIAVPGQVAGMAKALERFGTLKWQDVMAPASARQARHGTRLVHAGDDRQRGASIFSSSRPPRPTTCPTAAACRPTIGSHTSATSSW